MKLEHSLDMLGTFSIYVDNWIIFQSSISDKPYTYSIHFLYRPDQDRIRLESKFKSNKKISKNILKIEYSHYKLFCLNAMRENIKL